MIWDTPPDIKIYEALGAVADLRVHISGSTARVYSSSGNKYYEVSYDSRANSIMANDNGSYWKGYLGYPSIAFLLQSGILEYRPALADLLKGVPWKDLNQKFKNNFNETLGHILQGLKETDKNELEAYMKDLSRSIGELRLQHLGKKVLPPIGY